MRDLDAVMSVHKRLGVALLLALLGCGGNTETVTVTVTTGASATQP
jgi:hypothetical protein